MTLSTIAMVRLSPMQRAQLDAARGEQALAAYIRSAALAAAKRSQRTTARTAGSKDETL